VIEWGKIAGFDWDDGNRQKSALRHDVTTSEAEQMFSNAGLLVWPDAAHSGVEARYQALGTSNSGRLLFASFTLRTSDTLIRVISVRDMNAKERRAYAQETQSHPPLPQRS
jgi:uncharacterized DUF497 family protein